jgi:macrophage erythroblast attacher
VDYMLRKGFNETAKKMAEDSNISVSKLNLWQHSSYKNLIFELQEMVDVELFTQSAKIEDALKRHSCTECIQWCSDNRNSLKKLKVSTILAGMSKPQILSIVMLTT